jgi:3-hydroxymyristoyl/3-hydroxydecanoyl-(acyl carrier protein) dehydratase
MTVKKSTSLWYECKVDESAPDGHIHAQIRVPADSPWFDGHFPERPLLPGVAQLGMVHDMLCRTSGHRLMVEQVTRIRFKQMIGPDQAVVLTIKPGENPGNHSFRITGDEGLICSGLIRLKAIEA